MIQFKSLGLNLMNGNVPVVVGALSIMPLVIMVCHGQRKWSILTTLIRVSIAILQKLPLTLTIIPLFFGVAHVLGVGCREALIRMSLKIMVDVDGSDNLHIVAECSDGVYYLTRSIDGSWSAPVLISNVPGEPRIFVDDANIPHVVWLYDNPSNDTYTIFYATQPWREGVNVTVQDNNANPVTDVKAEVYRVQDGPDEKLGTTDSAGKITFTANAWDKIYAVYVGDPEPTNKAYHDGWYRKRYQASEVYTIQNTDDITLNLTRNTYAFNLVVSIEWDAEDFYVRQVAVGFANASSVVSRHE